jgi:DNA repair protein RecO (recombination protein O)
MQHRDSAICLRTSDYSETSQIVHFLGRTSGVLRLLAKGAKRKKSSTGGAIDLMSEGDLVYIPHPAGSLGTLVEFTETDSHLALRTDAGRLNTGLYMIELAGALLAEADPHPEVFDLLHNALARLGEPDAPPAAVLAWFQWRTLRHVGLMGDLTACAACGRHVGPNARGMCFSSSEGGLVCSICAAGVAEKHRLDRAALAGLDALAAVAAGRKTPLPDNQAHAVNRVLAYHVANQLGKPLKMARYAIEPGG